VRIKELLRDADKEDLVLVYYSGHGFQNSHGKLHLATVDTNDSFLNGTSVSLTDVRECLLQSRCQRFVLILDCCYAGAAGHDFSISKDTEWISDPNGVGEFVMAASTAIATAGQRQDQELSVFTKHLVEGMRTGKADDE